MNHYGYCSAPWRAEDIATLTGIFRRARARRRRGTGTKSGRRERRRYYLEVTAPTHAKVGRR